MDSCWSQDYVNSDSEFERLLAVLSIQAGQQPSMISQTGLSLSAQISVSTSASTSPPPYSAPSPAILRRQGSQLPVSSNGQSVVDSQQPSAPVTPRRPNPSNTFRGNWISPSNSLPSSSGKKVAYTVLKGYQPGIYDNWSMTNRQVHGYPGALMKGFSSRAVANQVFRRARALQLIRGPHIVIQQPPSVPVPSSAQEAQERARSFDPTVVIRDYYVVTRGIIPSVYASWLESSANTLGVSGALSESYSSFDEALHAWNDAVTAGEVEQILE
ncbi:hypothetical protein DL96DRAFT_1721323 [Flagelloscypha sp. PMI_526]|nr:hypothetical protein DL96DRAFT_1721323 [Flagelloscypha sp. PMI_526]